MYTLGQFLAKYESLAPPQQSTLRLVVQVVYDECGVELEEKDVSLVRGGIMLACHPILRIEVARSAAQILTTLHERHAVRLSFIR
jgi:hypothetical protein